MTIHNLKIMKEFADDVYSGNKTFEVRKDDRNFKVGNLICFRVVHDQEFIEHPLNDTRWQITYIMGHPYILEDHVILAIKRVR